MPGLGDGRRSPRPATSGGAQTVTESGGLDGEQAKQLYGFSSSVSQFALAEARSDRDRGCRCGARLARCLESRPILWSDLVWAHPARPAALPTAVEAERTNLRVDLRSCQFLCRVYQNFDGAEIKSYLILTSMNKARGANHSKD